MEDKIELELQTGCDDVDWIHLAKDEDSCERGDEPSGPIKGAKFLD